jgi:tetratricopeptide (TPR) repeat protein
VEQLQPAASAADRSPTPTKAQAALATALAELDAAELHGEPARLAESLADVSRCYATIGMAAHRRWYLQQALRFSALLAAVDTSVDLLCELADACIDGSSASGEESDDPQQARCSRDMARDRLYEATRLAARSADPQWEVTVLLRVSDLLDRMGDHEDAVAIQRRALDLINRGAVQPLV